MPVALSVNVLLPTPLVTLGAPSLGLSIAPHNSISAVVKAVLDGWVV